MTLETRHGVLLQSRDDIAQAPAIILEKSMGIGAYDRRLI
jgi:hypothetical protein